MAVKLRFQQFLSASQCLSIKALSQATVAYSAATLVSILGVSVTSPAQAAIINRTFTGGERPFNSSGNGDLITIFDTAANYWEDAILDDIEFSINVGWSGLGATTLAEFTPIATTGSPERTLEGSIQFNSDTRLFSWYLDESPTTNKEFGSFTAVSEDFGGGALNAGRVYTNPNTAARDRFDLLTIAIHELGHAFGILNAYEAFDEETFEDDDIDVPQTLPFVNSQIPTTPINGGHLDIETAALFPFFEPGTRILLSEVDIIAAAVSTGSSQINLNPQPTPIPQQTPETSGTVVLPLLIGAAYLKQKRL